MDNIHGSIDSCQKGDPLISITWPYRGLRCRPIGVEYLFEVIRWQVTCFQMIAGSSLFVLVHMKYVVFCMCRTIKMISNWPRKLKFSQFLQAGRHAICFWLFSPRSRVGHALRPIFMLCLVKIWQVSSWGKFMHHLETCLLWQLKLTEFCVNLWCFWLSFSTGCTKWNTAAIKSLLLFMASLFIGVLVERCVACHSRKSDFGWHRFLFSRLPWGVKGFNSFQELHLEW